MSPLPQRKQLPHDVPSWVQAGSRYFITINSVPRGVDQCCISGRAQRLIENAQIYHFQHTWHMALFLVMPDHIHMILSFNPEKQVKRVIASWKGYQAKHLEIRWQSGFFEHRLRNDNEFVEKMNYVRMNPVRKELASSPGEWPHCWCP